MMRLPGRIFPVRDFLDFLDPVTQSESEVSSVKPLYPQSPKSSADAVVDAFFSRLASRLDTVDAIAMDRAEILAYFAQPVLRQAHRQHALADIARYQAVAADVLLTAASLCLHPSAVSQALLVDWLTMAPDFVLERLSA